MFSSEQPFCLFVFKVEFGSDLDHSQYVNQRSYFYMKTTFLVFSVIGGLSCKEQ